MRRAGFVGFCERRILSNVQSLDASAEDFGSLEPADLVWPRPRLGVAYEQLRQLGFELVDRMAEQLLKAKQLAARLGVALLTVYRMAERGRIPSVPIGRMLRFDFDAVLKHLVNSEAAKRDKLCLRERGAERRAKVPRTQHFSRGYVRLRIDVAMPYYEGQYRIYRHDVVHRVRPRGRATTSRDRLPSRSAATRVGSSRE